jgi:hypothetical protein
MVSGLEPDYGFMSITPRSAAKACSLALAHAKETMAYAKVKSADMVKRWIDEGYNLCPRRSGEWIVDRESIDKWFENENFS